MLNYCMTASLASQILTHKKSNDRLMIFYDLIAKKSSVQYCRGFVFYLQGIFITDNSATKLKRP